MLFDLPDFQTLYTALLTRDERYDGQAFVCVSSTGVFCRLTCPARKPKAENCIFHATIGECIQAGFSTLQAMPSAASCGFGRPHNHRFAARAGRQAGPEMVGRTSGAYGL